MTELFGRDMSVISRHLRKIFQSGELKREATVAKNATVQSEGGREVVREIEFFNLDAILSVGYRVNSTRGTQFRIWATRTLREHLVRGYTLDRQRIARSACRRSARLAPPSRRSKRWLDRESAIGWLFFSQSLTKLPTCSPDTSPPG